MSILKTWKNIKNLRKKNKYQSTALKLVIKKEEVDKEEEEEKRKVELEEEMKEILEEYDEDFAKKMKKYEKEMAEWKAAHKKRVCCLSFLSNSIELRTKLVIGLN